MGMLLSLVEEYKKGTVGTDVQILKLMEPLLKNYAHKLYCMEYEDAIQELSVAILEALPYLNPEQTEGECVCYIQRVVSNRYKKLCRKILSRPQTENIDDCVLTLKAQDCYDDTFFAFQTYIEKLPKAELRYQIISRFFYEEKSDKEIAEELHISKQYVNRLKKEIIRTFFSMK